MVKIAGGAPKRIPTDEHFKLTPETMEDNIGDKTKLLILNSPNNPTGTIYSEQENRGLAEVLMDNNVYVISDEIYEKMVYDEKHFSIGSIPGMDTLAVTINGFPKAYAMTGWRLGYAAGLKEVISAMNKIQQHTVTCAAITPGRAFGGYDTHSRISFANSVENLIEAVKRIKEILGQLEIFTSLTIESRTSVRILALLYSTWLCMLNAR